MEAKDFKPGITFKKYEYFFKVVKNESKIGLPDMLLFKTDKYYEYYGNIGEIKNGIVNIYHCSPIGDNLIHEIVTLSGLTLIE